MHACMHACMHTYIHTYGYTYVYIYMYIHMHTFCINRCIYTKVYVHICAVLIYVYRLYTVDTIVSDEMRLCMPDLWQPGPPLFWYRPLESRCRTTRLQIRSFAHGSEGPGRLRGHKHATSRVEGPAAGLAGRSRASPANHPPPPFGVLGLQGFRVLRLWDFRVLGS